ncbi:MAG: DUF4840 domain-containing protein, partial [Leadbetterella sp.]|nr:DUF4840 domain-containing protein [Leadbetterella sp.]
VTAGLVLPPVRMMTNPLRPLLLKVEDVNENYSGKLTTTQGKTKGEANTAFIAKNNIISFEDLPVKAIVGTVIKDTKKADEAIKKIGKVKYDLNYSPKLNASKTTVDLSFSPKSLEIQVPVDGVNKKVVATLSTKQSGSYTGKDKSVTFSLNVDKITVDGTAVAPFEAIQYSFPKFAKNKRVRNIGCPSGSLCFYI